MADYFQAQMHRFPQTDKELWAWVKATWGVTIPAGMSRQLNDYLRQHTGGSLIIDAQGDLRLEQ